MVTGMSQDDLTPQPSPVVPEASVAPIAATFSLGAAKRARLLLARFKASLDVYGRYTEDIVQSMDELADYIEALGGSRE